MKDLAELTGYSVATISRVINQSPKVSEETRRKVEEAIRRTGYHPNFIGRNLRSAASMKIMVLLPTLDNTFYSKVLLGAEETAQKAGYQIIVGVTHNTVAIEENYIAMLRSCQVDGMVFANTILDKFDLNRLAESYPVALLAHNVPGANLSCVSIDNVAAAREAVQYLISLGHKKIAMISGCYYQNPSADREQGYREALESAGLPWDPGLILRADFNFASGYAMAEKLMKLDEPPTAIFCVADSIAIGALRYLISAGLDQTVSVMGFDDVQESEYIFNGISTVSQPKYELGQKSVELLLEKIRDLRSDAQALVLPHKLVIRGSTRTFAGSQPAP